MFDNITREFRLSKFQTFLRILVWGGLAWGAYALGISYWWEAFLFFAVAYSLIFLSKIRRDRRYSTVTIPARQAVPLQSKTSSGSNGLKVPDPLNRDH